MDREQTKYIIKVISATYSNFKPNNISDTIDAWSFFLADYNYNDIAMALKKYVSTSGSGFPPSCDQLVAMIGKEDELAEETEAEAWAMVSKAIRRGNYYAEEDFNKFPLAVQRAIGSAETIRVLASSENYNESVESSNFKRVYREIVKRQREDARIKIGSKAEDIKLLGE